MRTTLLLTLFLCLSTTARAGILLEPDLGVEYGKQTETYSYPSAPTVEGSNSGGGITYGAKAGFTAGGLLMAGAQYEGGSLSFAKPSDLGVFAGVKIPLLFHAWVSYFLKSTTTQASGSGFELGAGIPFLFLLDLNLEYASRKYNSYTGTLPTNATYSATLKTFKLTVGLPLGF